jgi:PAS domain S-box-containing protein
MAAIPSILIEANRRLTGAMESALVRYSVALAIFLLALGLRVAIFPQGGGYPFFTFYPAVTIVALVCGIGPSLLFVLISSLLCDYLFLEPIGSFAVRPSGALSLLIYAASSVFICYIVHKRTRQETEMALLAAVVDSSNDAIVSKNLQGIILSWNHGAEKLFGYSAAEAIGKPMTMVFPPDRISEEAAFLEKMSRGERIERYETVRKRQDGSLVEVSVTLAPLYDRAGRIVGASKMAHDITQRKILEEGVRQSNRQLLAAKQRLERSNRELDDFAYIASHDLKEPLRGIHNYVSFLQEDYAEKLDEEGRSFLNGLHRLTERQTKLIDCLLTYSRLGQATLPMTEVDLNLLLKEVAEDLRPFLADLGVELRRPLPLPTVHCNSMRIGEVFQNLIANAAKYNDKPEKWVEVGWREQNGVEVIYVRDNGIGIPEQHRDAVFRIFKRLHEQNKFGGGVGAGLTIVKKIIERHGGRIWLESTPGEGTTFYFTLSEEKA